MADFISGIVEFLNQYWPYLIIAGLALFVMYLFGRGNKQQPKPVDRGEVERTNFLRRMDANKSFFRFMKQRNKTRWIIDRFQMSKKKDGETEFTIYEMVMRPALLGRIPFGKPQGYTFNRDSIEYDFAHPKTLILKDWVYTWLRNGVYIDNTLSKNLISYFNREYSAQTDLENLSAEYYAMGQEQSVIQPERGHVTLQKHLDIEEVKEKTKKQQLGG